MLSDGFAGVWEHRWKVLTALALVSGFAVGRYSSTPPEVHESSEVADAITKTQTVWASKSYERVTDTKYVRVTDKKFRPDGTLESEHTEARAVAHSEEHAAENSGGRTDVHEDRTEHTRRDLTPALPKFRLSILAGASLTFEPLAVAPRLGLGLDYRIIGPFSLGALVIVRPHPLDVAALGSVSVVW